MGKMPQNAQSLESAYTKKRKKKAIRIIVIFAGLLALVGLLDIVLYAGGTRKTQAPGGRRCKKILPEDV